MEKIDRKLVSAIDDYVLSIIKEEAPEEVDIFGTTSKAFFSNVTRSTDYSTSSNQIFSFASAEPSEFLADALRSGFIFFVIPFIGEIYKTILKRPAEKFIDLLAEKIHQMRSSSESEEPERIYKEIYVYFESYLDWTKLENGIVDALRKSGRSKKKAIGITEKLLKDFRSSEERFGRLIVHTISTMPTE